MSQSSILKKKKTLQLKVSIIALFTNMTVFKKQFLFSTIHFVRLYSNTRK